MAQHTLPRHVRLTGPKDVNAQELPRFSRSVLDYPVATPLSGDPGTIANTGATSDVTWSPPSNPLFDTHQMIGASSTVNVRIPVDGFYSFWMPWRFGDTLNARTEFACRMYVATTSDTGFGAISYSEVNKLRCTRTFDGSTHLSVDAYFTAEFRGIELHANDMVKFTANTSSTLTLTSTNITNAEFRYLGPIPQGNV
jgi:hypothetical protein